MRSINLPSSHLRKSGASLQKSILRKENLLWTPANRCTWWAGRFEFRNDFQVSDDSHNSQWRSADAWRGNSLRQRMGKFLTVKLLEDTPAVLSLGKLREDHWYSYERTNGQQPCLIKNGVRIQCSTENYVPIVVPGSSTNSSSSSSSGSPSPTSLPHESTGSTPIPASIECESADERTRGNPSSHPTQNPKPNKDVDH